MAVLELGDRELNPAVIRGEGHRLNLVNKEFIKVACYKEVISFTEELF